MADIDQKSGQLEVIRSYPRASEIHPLERSQNRLFVWIVNSQDSNVAAKFNDQIVNRAESHSLVNIR